MISSKPIQASSQKNRDYQTTLANIKKMIPLLANIAKDIKEYALEFMRTIDKLEIKEHNFTPSNLGIDSELFQKDELFAELYTQSIIYGTFCSWIKFCSSHKDSTKFTIKNLASNHPYGKILHKMYGNSRNSLSNIFRSLIDELINVFQTTTFHTLLNNSESLITTFYSEFLLYYDPLTAKQNGMIYTPEPIVIFMYDAIHHLCQTKLNIPNGVIGSTRKNKKENLIFLDPAAGTMAFAGGLLKYTGLKFQHQFGQQSKKYKDNFQLWLKDYFFPYFYSFEVLPAPYVLGHIRLLHTLDRLDVPFQGEELNIKYFLQNTLDSASNHKFKSKMTTSGDTIVIIGNPPYNLSSQNNCKWITEKIQDYKQGLQEKNQKILADDYVKFIRFAQWKVEQVGTGVVAMITNSRYLEGQMFSVMRNSLRQTFDHIYIVDLHGDMRKKESGNPFDIRVGVCIAFMVRIDNRPNKNAAIHYMDVPQNTREEKFAILAQGFEEGLFELLPETKKNYFVKLDMEHLDRYETFTPINKFFKRTPTSGIMAGRDHLVMDTDETTVRSNLTKFFNKDFETLEQLKVKVHDSKSWKKEKIFSQTNLEDAKNTIQTVQYRGFDHRYIAYDRSIVEGHRMGYIDQINQGNPAITVSKSSRKPQFCTAFISTRLIEKCFMSVTDTAYAFLLNYDGQSNVLLPILDFTTSQEEFFYYIYGVLFSPTYRTRYDAYLRKSFPGIPLPSNQEYYRRLSELGFKLAQAHTLNISIDPSLETADIAPDQWIIQNFRFDKRKECIFFNDLKKNPSTGSSDLSTPWIKGISQAMWEFQIGNIPQLSQFLKSRQFNSTQKWNTLQRGLTHEELIIFLKICSAIKKTLQLLPLLDSIYQKMDVIGF
ncbi:hypothetical protein NEF87_003676 [Candidatus Lokiarchaeum ossiferum]|uniref:site-specific DNA-methyltransferase (adenine-specific) n=1 Tax=Candidatus Lokiarchaeum ossiferum TaxID=2951803 RepID=A0ABY6HVG6_9ARCH|nr:hypothetical protein NEF87_003676 [Candidatus Lokiarchaeum sp. B-35]